MSKANLLNTRDINFMELIGNGKLYRVPPFQRDYSWEEEQWEDLWNDLMELRATPDERHYMGALVVEAKSDREFKIIDGQQRIATLTILALAVIQKLKQMAEGRIEADANTERAQGLRNKFVGEKDPASLVESSKLHLNESDNAFFQDYLVQLRPPRNPRGLPKSNRLLWQCFQYFQTQLNTIPNVAENGEALARILSETVARQLLFILITVDDELNAYMVFETLNARGLELSSTDLLKNYLFSRVTVPADLEALQRRWRTLITVVRQERFPEFLRYHLLCEQPKIRTQRLFKMVRDRVAKPQQVFDLMESLDAKGELFAALSDPNHGYWVEYAACRSPIRELNLFRIRQMTPLLFAAWEKLSKDAFADVLKLVSVISFRYSVVGGLNTNALEPTYHQAAKAVLVGTAGSPREVFQNLRPIYVDDRKFEQDFAALVVDTSGQHKRLAKYILCRLEEDTTERPCDPDTDPATIEHILPENPADVWCAAFPKDKWEGNVYRLGNLALLESGPNRTVGNAEYDQKRDAYATSMYATTKRIAADAPERWTPELLEARQQFMARRAVHVWRSPYVQDNA
jgi:hypothetical protein